MTNPYCGVSKWPVSRKQKHPQYDDEEMDKFYAEVSKGFDWKQAADNAGLVRDVVDNTLRSCDLKMDKLIDVSIKAGARIRAGEQEIPSRRDGLYDKYRRQ